MFKRSNVMFGAAAAVLVFASAAMSDHTVLGEYATATWCGYCKYAHGALIEIDDEAQYDFVYVVHVTDKCAWATQRASGDYNVYGYPTVYFDGGDEVKVGAGSVPSAKASYISAINACNARVVPSLTITQQVVWTDDAVMGIRVGITNNEATAYEGYLRTFVTETDSSLGWNDTWNVPYTYAFLDYAFDEPDLVIDPYETVVYYVDWVGAEHQNGYNVYYDNIQRDNITVVTGVYNDEWHQGYSYNNTRPFDAYYVDQADRGAPLLAGDANGDNLVDIDDIFDVLSNWGPCDVCLADVNMDGLVDIDDIFYVLSNWT